MGISQVDHAILAALNGSVGRWPTLDRLVVVLAGNHLLKGGVMMALVWWAWFCRGGRRDAAERRGRIVATFAAAAVALAIASVIEWLFPFRPRPIHDPALALHAPIGVASDVMSDWSSFPSDHATLFLALATGLLFVSRPLGLAACAYAAIVILLPRVYL